MKKNYTVSLDEDKVEEMKGWLETRGLTFSGYLNSLIDEQMAAVKTFAVEGGGVSKVTAGKLLKMATKMVRSLNAEAKK
jgi:hypothetical protein